MQILRQPLSGNEHEQTEILYWGSGGFCLPQSTMFLQKRVGACLPAPLSLGMRCASLLLKSCVHIVNQFVRGAQPERIIGADLDIEFPFYCA